MMMLNLAASHGNSIRRGTENRKNVGSEKPTVQKLEGALRCTAYIVEYRFTWEIGMSEYSGCAK